MKLATLRDGSRDGKLIVVKRDGSVAAPAAGIAPTLRAALDDWERAEPQLRIEPHKTSLASEQIRVETKNAEIAAGTLSTVARAVAAKAESIALTADKYELVAARLFEKSRDAFREVVDLAETRVGRARTIVSTIFSLSTRRTVLTSKEETSVDGRKILLG